jgi:hypothetical protein
MTFGHIYATGPSGMNGTAFKLTNVTEVVVGVTQIDADTAYSTVYALTGTSPGWGSGLGQRASGPAGQREPAGSCLRARDAREPDQQDVGRDRKAVIVSDGTEWRPDRPATAMGAWTCPAMPSSTCLPLGTLRAPRTLRASWPGLPARPRDARTVGCSAITPAPRRQGGASCNPGVHERADTRRHRRPQQRIGKVGRADRVRHDAGKTALRARSHVKGGVEIRCR